ncbi:MAG: hypothetical protein CUN56_10050 [Phototrophicales bacterium]|nr:MAG: hypothetical protein CUN56_10050 [Phototrophicales bacterium]RMG75032.1 MAG: isoprenylcysteine carboxylmethyltransferase family protein [Chloroflexota bacterium]
MSEAFFRLSFAILIVIIAATRTYGNYIAGTLSATKRQKYDDGWITVALRPVSVVIVLSALVYLIMPSWMAWSQITLPDWIRIAGIGFGGISAALMAWVQQTLHKNFSGQLSIREDHTLVTRGPYRWVRHPMYTATVLLFFSVFLITANWFIGIGGMLMVLAVIIHRTPKEEAMLTNTFGDAYKTYMQKTTRYIPFIF